MTTYRIRYSQDGGGQNEAVIEATSPSEAIVKFHHTLAHPNRPGVLRDRVVSVSADAPSEADFRW